MKSNKLEVLVSTLENNPEQLYNSMNLVSDSVIINQSNRTKEYELKINENTIKVYDYNERGIGKSRNKGLMSIEGDICLIADDDLRYVDGYEEIVLKAFDEIPSADIIIFDIKLINISKEITKERKIKKIKRLNTFNSMRYGACRMAIKMESLKKNNIWFSLLFGGGARYSAGEDSLFLRECFKKNMKVYSYPKIIAYVDESDSTWYNGVNKKYLKDKGAFLGTAYPKLCNLLAIYYSARLYKIYKKEYTFLDSYKSIREGIAEIKNI